MDKEWFEFVTKCEKEGDFEDKEDILHLMKKYPKAINLYDGNDKTMLRMKDYEGNLLRYVAIEGFPEDENLKTMIKDCIASKDFLDWDQVPVPRKVVKEIDFDSIEFLRNLGEGAAGEVLLVYRKDMGVFVLKVYKDPVIYGDFIKAENDLIYHKNTESDAEHFVRVGYHVTQKGEGIKTFGEANNCLECPELFLKTMMVMSYEGVTLAKYLSGIRVHSFLNTMVQILEGLVL